MKMCGATDGFIEWPFVVEGMLLGLTGALIAFLGQWGLLFNVHHVDPITVPQGVVRQVVHNRDIVAVPGLEENGRIISDETGGYYNVEKV